MSLFLIEAKRSWILLRRYPADLLSTFAALTLTFYALVMGAQYVAGPSHQFGERLDGVILGYWLWTLAVFALSNTASSIQTEALTGTLEQVYLTPPGGLRLFVIRAAAALALNLVSSVVLLALMLWLTDRTLSFPPTLLLPLIAALLGAYGLGFAMAGLALLYKRVQRALSLFQFFLLFLVIVPVEEGSETLAAMLPITSAAAMLRDMMARGEALDWRDLAITFASCGFYLTIGMLLFLRSDREARRRGLLAQY